MEVIGEISEIAKLSYSSVISWKIRKFISLSKTSDKGYCSPSFSIADASWCLCIWPNGEKKNSSEGFTGLYLMRKSLGVPITLKFSVGLTTIQTINPTMTATHEFKRANEICGCPKFLSRRDFLLRRSDFAPASVLSVICCLNNCKPIAVTNHVQLMDDFKALMLSGEQSDVIVKVKGEVFRLHRNILASRNPFFCLMFKSEMKEKITGIVSIDDCEPNIFRSFIHFLYTGKVDELSHGNVCGLYEISEKYQENRLKNECIHFIINSFTIDTICDVVELSLRHSDDKIMDKIIQFFASHVLEIIQTVKWQAFFAKYPIQGYQILIQAHEYSRDKQISIGGNIRR